MASNCQTGQRVLFVCHLPPPVHGAAMMGAAVINSKRVAEICERTVIPIRMTDKLDALHKFSFVKVWYSFKLWFEVAVAIVRTRPHAVYLTPSVKGFSLLRDYVTVLICKSLGSRRILHLHTKGLRLIYEGSLFYRVLHRSVFWDADVIHQSAVFYEDVSCVVRRERFYPVANATNVDGVVAPSSDTVGHVPVILFLSNLMEQKGPLDLLEASNRLVEKGVKHKLVFVGAASEDKIADLITLAMEADGERISFVGPQYGPEKSKMLSNADIFAFPTYYYHETQSIVVMEAMGHGLAVVASSEGAIPDLLKNGAGLLFPPRDVTQLTAQLQRLIEEPKLRESLGKVARQRYQQTYTLEAFEKRFCEALQSILSASPMSRETSWRPK